MLERDIALVVRNKAIKAVEELTTILYEIEGRCSPEEFDVVKRGVGRSIGRIQMEILENVISHYPDLDDLK